jgi:endogenous inhibitor of DNA gyrase (YacG/DUF329 family)
MECASKRYSEQQTEYTDSKALSAMPTPLVPCPHCGKKIEWNTQNPFRPFCSARCKQIDLGAWASGSYFIAPSTDDSSENPSEPIHNL